ncbi:hypothetical protein ACP26L_17975 [Paenibacillus sp. S-38]|uniref:hypothetical protein n=1 Tax=Paenibacillus sp. S-38 TaxID=3416710 RepID=UPI003CE8E5D7
MKMHVSLPVEPPIITSWSNQSHVFSIAQRHPGCKPWIYSHYIQTELITGLSGKDTLLNYSHITTPQEDCPWIEISRTNVQQIQESEGDLVSFFKESLLNGYYIYAFVDMYYIPAYPFYQLRHAQHDSLLLGFNEEQERFYMADFHKHADGANRYGIFEVSYAQLTDSILHLKEELNPLKGIELFRYRTDVSYAFDTERVKQSLSDYLESTYTPRREPTWLSTPVLAYGIACYDHLIQHIEEIRTDSGIRDFRFFHVMGDHKLLMVQRLQYMHEIGLIRAERAEAYEEILQDASILRNLLLKFGLTENIRLLDRISLLLRKIAECEKNILGEVLEDLKTLTPASVQA